MTTDRISAASRARACEVFTHVDPDNDSASEGARGAVLEAIRMNGALNDVMIWSTHPHVIAQFRDYQPSIPVSLLTGGEEWADIDEFFREALWRGAQACSIHHSVLTPEVAHRARLRGLGPYTWTVNEERELRRVIDCGVAGIITDYPDRLLGVLAES